MNIDITSLIIGLVLLSFFIIPIVMDQLKNKKQTQGIEEEFLNLAKSKQVTITNYDILHNTYAIGIDKKSKKILYLNTQNDEDNKALIDLAAVKKCQSFSPRSPIKNQPGNVEATDQAGLIFTFRNPNKSEKKIAFIGDDQHQDLQTEIAFVEKWADIINSNL